MKSEKEGKFIYLGRCIYLVFVIYILYTYTHIVFSFYNAGGETCGKTVRYIAICYIHDTVLVFVRC